MRSFPFISLSPFFYPIYCGSCYHFYMCIFVYFKQPFRLNDGKRQWVFGGELYKFEGRHLKQYWAMLFTDLLLFTKINRDRVIFVMQDPVPLASVCQALFNVKKKGELMLMFYVCMYVCVCVFFTFFFLFLLGVYFLISVCVVLCCVCLYVCVFVLLCLFCVLCILIVICLVIQY